MTDKVLNDPMHNSSELHKRYGGKMETIPKCPIRGLDDFSVWYSPGVAQPCLDIARDPDLVYEYTGKWNTVAVISDGSRVLGLGDIGPKAGLPVMEGKAMLYKYLGGVDSVALMLDTKDPDEFIAMVQALQPSFGGINLEDIAQPKCFRILDALKERCEIPVWHDDQQGTATAVLAGLSSALKVVGKQIHEVRVAFIGAGAANVATARLLFSRGVNPGLCCMTDAKGLLGAHRHDILDRPHNNPEQARLCALTNTEGRIGGNDTAMVGADVVIAFAKPGPGTLLPSWVSTMAPEAIVFACANPVPEIWPHEALAAGAAIVATGRSDFPNQINNSLVFPGVFRGALDVRARTINDAMCFAAADVLADWHGELRSPTRLLPSMEDWEVVPLLAAGVGRRAIDDGLARIDRSHEDLVNRARSMIQRTRTIAAWMDSNQLLGPPA